MNYKGFNKDLSCRGFQYEIGREYEQNGPVQACKRGFHACEDPLDVFKYYPPASSRYCQVEQSGTVDKDDDDTKVASSKIKIGAELSIRDLVKAKMEYVKARTNTEHADPKMATAGYHGAATAGYAGAATSRGSVTVGKNGVGLVRGTEVKARGGLGAVLVICIEPDTSYDIADWKAVLVDGEKVKADTWYTLKNGELEEVKED
jgi:hypothetical protein